MGGAAIAAGNDSAMPYLNPAGLAGVPGDVFAISASVHAYSSRSIPNPFAPNGFASVFGPTQGFSSTTESSGGFELPTSVAYFKHLGDPETVHHVVGVALIIPSAQRFGFVGHASARFPSGGGSYSESLSISRSDTHTYVGPSYALGLGRRLRFGASALVLYRQQSLDFNDTFAIDQIGLLGRGTNSSSSNAQTLSLVGVVGVQANVVANLWLGAGVVLPGLPITGRLDGNSTTEQVVADPGSSQVLDQNTATVAKAETRTPLRIGVGAAWDDRDHFSGAADLHVFLAQPDAFAYHGSSTISASETGARSRLYVEHSDGASRTIQAIGVSVGGEAKLTTLFALRAGVFTDSAISEPILDPPDRADVYRARYDRLGASLGVGLQLGSFDSTLGAVYEHGSGYIALGDATSDQAFAASVFQTVRGTTSEDTVMLVISGAVTTEEAKRTIEQNMPAKGVLP